VAVAASRLYGISRPVTVLCKSQEKIICHMHEVEDKMTNFFLQGPAQHVFDGKVALYRL